MPSLDTYTEKQVQRILLVGDPGSGKTTAYGHLLEHGQKLFVADFDKGLDPIIKHVPREFHKNLIYAPLIDKVRPHPVTGYKVTPGKPTAFRKFIRLMNEWQDDDGTNYGKPESWDENTWLVIDNLTSMGEAALLFVQDERNKMNMKVSMPTLGAAIERVSGVPASLLSYPINVIMLAHLAMQTSADEDAIGEDDDSVPGAQKIAVPKAPKIIHPNDKKRYPYTLGKKLPRRIGAYFTTILQCKVVGEGAAAKRVIRTVPDPDVDVKLPAAPKALPPELPINGLWDIIQALRNPPTK